MRLEAKKISFSYDREKYLFRELDLSFESNERTAIVAPSGYGKTTLAKILAGYEKKFLGSVEIDGNKIMNGVFNPVQLILQHPENAVNPRWKMKKVLSEAGSYDEKLLSSLGIENAWLNRYPIELSGGELQRFCVARAMLSNTRFLIADEITAMLDAITQAQLWNYILKTAEEQNIGLIVITHNKALIEKICTKTIDLTELSYS